MKSSTKLLILSSFILLNFSCTKNTSNSDSTLTLFDCIDNCNQTGGEAIQSQDVIELPCECDCYEGYDGELCNQSIFPIGFNLEQINIIYSNNVVLPSAWDDTVDPASRMADPFLNIYIEDSLVLYPDVTLAGSTETIQDINYSEEYSFTEGILPLFLPYLTPLSFEMLDYDSGSTNHESMISVGFTLNSNDIEEGDTINNIYDDPLDLLYFEITLIGDWVY